NRPENTLTHWFVESAKYSNSPLLLSFCSICIFFFSRPLLLSSRLRSVTTATSATRLGQNGDKVPSATGFFIHTLQCELQHIEQQIVRFLSSRCSSNARNVFFRCNSRRRFGCFWLLLVLVCF